MAILTEDLVVESVCEHLSAAGWTIEARAALTQQGYDVVAVRDGRRLIIEAKGEGSAREGSARFGKTFSTSQVFDHVGKAVLKAMRVCDLGHLGAVALPADPRHQAEVALVSRSLSRLSIGVFWVSAERAVTLNAPWSL